ncbi:class II fumarate hydratase [Halothiobacillus sp. DCM-1]|uniref:class II fumarate hydratase n=1 Tax=Halothiobacillus sp. DCM-1 TaxID=3112558 RepID=UPI00324A25EC
MTAQTRIEHDSLGTVVLPADALWGAQTQRAIENFPVSGQPLPPLFIQALARVKAACAQANQALGLLSAEACSAITAAAAEIQHGAHLDAFPIDVYQTGSGTSTNMNANEVIARLAAQRGVTVHPNDHVNMSQSSNDVIPTALRVAAVEAVTGALIPAMDHIRAVLRVRAAELATVTKTGRTHLMDAMPIRFDQVLLTYEAQLTGAALSIAQATDRMRALPQGGTAVGTGINAPAGFVDAFLQALNGDSGSYRAMPLPSVGMAAQDEPVALSAALRGLAVVLMKLTNDLRLMNSGPLAGLSEISLPDLQPGSSIMPGKVNPVVPESVAMVAMQVQGLDTAIALAGQSGLFELNVALPLIANNLLQSITLLSQALRLLADKALAGFRVNQANLAAALDKNPILVTALNPVIGYELGAKIAKRAYAERRSVKEIAREMTDLDETTLERLLNPAHLT